MKVVKCRHVGYFDLGGVGNRIGREESIGCEGPALPGLGLCEYHAGRDAMAEHIRSLWAKVDSLEERLRDATGVVDLTCRPISISWNNPADDVADPCPFCGRMMIIGDAASGERLCSWCDVPREDNDA